MRLLLDTHIALWAILDDPRLPKAAADMIADPGNEVFVSVASVWEIAIKRALARGHKNDMPITAERAVFRFSHAGYELLTITSSHAVAVASLPMLHGDPFDRMLVAQALSEALTFLTKDAHVAAYSDMIVHV